MKALGQPKITLSQLDGNDLIYQPDIETTLTVQRHPRQQYAKRFRYMGGQGVIGVGQVMKFQFYGRHFASFPNSYLYFEFLPLVNQAKFNVTDDPNFGGSCINLINEVKVLTPGGVEISRTKKHNLLMYHLMKQKTGRWFNDTLQRELGGVNNIYPAGSSYAFNIPLRYISPFFDSDQLCPPCILDGIQIEIQLEAPGTAYSSANTNSRYEIRNAAIIMDSYILNKETTTIIERQSPLVYEYTSWVHSEGNIASSNVARNACLRLSMPLNNALETVTFGRNHANISNPQLDSFATIKPANDDQFQYQWGDVKYPLEPLKGIKQLYLQMLYANNKLARNNLDNFSVGFAAISNAAGNYSMASYNTLLKRSPYDECGVQVSQKSELLFLANFVINGNFTRIIDLFCKYSGRVLFKDGVTTVSQ